MASSLDLSPIKPPEKGCTDLLHRTARAERAFKLFFSEALRGRAENLTAQEDFDLRVALVDCGLTLLVSLVDLVRLLLPHLTNPRKWGATFLASDLGHLDQSDQLDQVCRSADTPGPTEPCADLTTSAAFRVVYLHDEQGNLTPFVDHSGSQAALKAMLASLPQTLREGALRAIGLLAAFKAGDQRLQELLDGNRELTPEVVRRFVLGAPEAVAEAVEEAVEAVEAVAETGGGA